MGRREPLLTTRPSVQPSRRGLVAIVGARGVSVTGDWVLITAASIIVYERTGSTTAVSLLLGLAAVPTVLLGPIAGAIADRADRRLMMFWADVVNSVLLVLGLVAAGGGDPVWPAYAAVAGVSVVGVFRQPAADALLPSLTGTSQLGRANSALRLATRLAMIAGPAAAGLLTSAGGLRFGLGVDAPSLALSALLVAAIPPSGRPRGVAKQASAFAQARAGFQYASHQRAIRIVILGIGSTMLMGPVVNAGTLALVSEALDLPESRYGLLLAVEGAGALSLAVVFLYLGPRLRLLPTGAGALIAVGASTIALGEAPNLLTAALAIAAQGMSVVALNITFASYLQQQSDDAFRGRVMSLVATIASLGGLAGFALAGPFVDAMGVRTAFALAGAVICIASVPVVKLSWDSARAEGRTAPTPA
jgi:MFS family permease